MKKIWGFMKKIFGKIIYGIGYGLSVVLNGIVNVLNWILEGVRLIGRGVVSLFFAGGCLLILLSPFFLALLFRPAVFTPLFIILMINLLGQPLISFLRYGTYVLTEFLMDYGTYLQDTENNHYNSFSDYSHQYQKKRYEEQREQQRREEEARREEYQRWQKEQEERFNEWFRNSGFGGYYTGQGQGQYGDYSGGGYSGRTYVNPNAAFRQEYENACDILGVPYNADKYQIKLAFRKMAKQYHPDVNSAPNATTTKIMMLFLK